MDILEILNEDQRRMSALDSDGSDLSDLSDRSDGSDAKSAASPAAKRRPSRKAVSERAREDFAYWCEQFVRIKAKGGGGDIPFILNPPQRMLVERFERMRLARRPIRLILLKARQWGGSTATQLYMAWLQLMHCEGLNSLIIAHQSVASEEIKEMFTRMMDHYPLHMLDSAAAAELAREEREAAAKGKPKKKKEVKKMENAGRSGLAFRIPSRNCKLKIGTAERPDSCRGGDYNLVHLSEVGIWKKTKGKSPEDIVRSACAGVLLTENTMIVLESTANGTGTFFHREYLDARRGNSQFEALFIPWYVIPQYRLPLTEKARRALAATLLAGRESDADEERRPSGRYLWSLWESGATLAGIAWYLEERRKYSDHAQMAAEYPSNDVEAFAHSGARVFARDKVEALRGGCRAPLLVGEVESSLPDGAPGCLRGIRFTADPQGGLSVWSEPCAGGVGRVRDRYVVIVDVGGRSTKADWSVILVLDRLSGGIDAVPEVAAQWRGHCDMDILAWKAARIAAWYDNALLVVESNTLETRDSGRYLEGEQSAYLLLQVREQYDNLYERPGLPDEIRGARPTRLGFHTNVRTKPMIISNMVKVIREGAFVERDERALTEMLEYERKDNGSYGAILGAHDDMLMARAIGLYISAFEMAAPARLMETGHAPRRLRSAFDR